ncbi:MAG: hypothetical protein HPY53_05925 [Brevinematales bacterium]|nr:hypothetical protein [Brevinematales bacterium]
MTWKTFTAAFAKYVNLDELVYDMTLVLLAVFFRGLIIPQGKTVLEILNPVSAIVITGLIYLFVSVLLGSLYRRFNPYKDKHPVLINIVTFILFATAGVLYIAINENLRGLGLLAPGNMYIPYMAGIFVMPAGFLFGNSDLSKEGCVTAAVMLSIGAGIAVFILFFYFVGEFGWLAGTGITLGGAGVYTLLLIGALRLSNKLFNEESKAAGVLRTVLFGILLPVIIALILGFWQEISIIGQAAVMNAGDVVPRVLLSLALYGIIPLRILIAAAPPYRVANTGVGIASLTVYFVTLLPYIESLIGRGK